MRNPETITSNIATRFMENFGRELTVAERMAVKSASGEALRKLNDLKVRAYVTENIGLANGLCRFEDIATGKDSDIRRAVHKEVMECLLEYVVKIGTRIGAIDFVHEALRGRGRGTHLPKGQRQREGSAQVAQEPQGDCRGAHGRMAQGQEDSIIFNSQGVNQ